jgi:hypothetical protein
MVSFLPRRPSPALVIAVIALIVALGGTGYAAITLPANSVGNEQLKRRAVTTTKIHRNAVTGSKVKRDTLRGRDINESTLAQVPAARRADVARTATSAGTANSANTADTATTANTANNANALQGRAPGDFVSSGEYKQVVAKMQAGDERELVRHGPLSVYARCATVGANDQLRMYAKTDVDGAIMYASWGDTRDGTDATDFLDTTTPEANREFDSSANGFPGSQSNAITPTGQTKLVDHYDENHLIAPTGHAISWESEAELIAFNYLGARCLIAGTVHLYRLG